MNTDQDFLSAIGQELSGNLVTYAIQQTRDFSCPGCGVILDCRDAVLLEVGGKSIVMCAGCWELDGRRIATATARKHGATLDVTDGRITNGRKSPNSVDPTTGCARHRVPKFGCKLCVAKRNKLQRLADDALTRREA